MLYLVWFFFNSVPLVVGCLFLFCFVPGCLLQGWYVHGSLCRFAPLCENKNNSLCEVLWVRYDTQCNKFCCVLATSYIYCIIFVEHNGDVSPKSYMHSYTSQYVGPFHILLTVHLGTNRVNNQHDALF